MSDDCSFRAVAELNSPRHIGLDSQVYFMLAHTDRRKRDAVAASMSLRETHPDDTVFLGTLSVLRNAPLYQLGDRRSVGQDDKEGDETRPNSLCASGRLFESMPCCIRGHWTCMGI